MTAPLRVIFCGHNRAGALVLKELLSSPGRSRVVWVWTVPETPPEAGVEKTVAQLAAEKGIPVFTGNPRRELAADSVRSQQPDLIVCSNYKYLIPRELYGSARLGAINVHGSLLPRYRGRMPNCWAIIQGETVTGVTAHQIDDGVDTGPVLAQERIPIDWRDTGATLVEKQIERCPAVVLKGIDNLLDPSFVPQPQREAEASIFPKRDPEDGAIRWDWPAKRIYDWIRAQTHPYPGSWTTHRGKRVMVWGSAYPVGAAFQAAVAGTRYGPGRVLGALVSPELSGVWVSTGSEPLLLTKVSAAGRSACSPYDWMLSKDWNEGDSLGD